MGASALDLGAGSSASLPTKKRLENMNIAASFD